MEFTLKEIINNMSLMSFDYETLMKDLNEELIDFYEKHFKTFID